jgi:hypothetical protein
VDARAKECCAVVPDQKNEVEECEYSVYVGCAGYIFQEMGYVVNLLWLVRWDGCDGNGGVYALPDGCTWLGSAPRYEGLVVPAPKTNHTI